MVLPLYNVKSFLASNAADLVAAINTFLATLTNPIIRRLDVKVSDEARRIGVEYTALLSWETGGSVIATPWLARIDESTSLTGLETTVQAFLTANPTYFISATVLHVLDNDANFKMKKWIGVTVYNTTAGAYANYGETVLSAPPT